MLLSNPQHFTLQGTQRMDFMRQGNGGAVHIDRRPNVRFGSKADIASGSLHVCFTPESGHQLSDRCNRRSRHWFDCGQSPRSSWHFRFVNAPTFRYLSDLTRHDCGQDRSQSTDYGRHHQHRRDAGMCLHQREDENAERKPLPGMFRLPLVHAPSMFPPI